MAEDKVKTSAFIVQGLSTLSIAYLTTISGFVFAWPSYTVQNFQSNDTVLSRPMTSSEISVLGSLPNIGALIATPFCDYAVNKFGRKYSAMLFGLPSIIAWSTISLTTSVPLVIAAVGIAGLGSAGLAVSSVYISEIAHDSIRGGLASTVVSGYFFGLLFSYIFGGYLSYHQVLHVHALLSVVYVLLLMLLHESPVYLVQNNREAEAAKSLAFYRRVNVTSKEIEVEIKKIKLQLDPRIDQILQLESESNGDVKEIEDLIDKKPKIEEKVSSWKFLMNSESSKKALVLVLTLMVSNTLMGAIVLQVYAEPLFKEAVPSMPSNLCAIFLAVVWILSCSTCAAIVDRFGRKFLMTWTSVGTGVCTLTLGVQLQIHFAPHWVTAFVIYLFCFVNYLGAATVPFIVAAEAFLPEVRGLGNSLTMATLWLTNFLMLIVFNSLLELFGLSPLFYGFTVVAFLTAWYSHCCLPETKGLSADAIQLLFLKKRKKQESQMPNKV